MIRRLGHLAGNAQAPALRYGIETRDRPGPLHKQGAFQDDEVWVQLHGGLFVGRARIRLAWIGEYSNVSEVRARTRGSSLHDVDGFWTGRPRYGYAAVASLQGERWLPEPFWAGPRTYGYEWIRLEDPKKRGSWLEPKDPPRGGEGLLIEFRRWLDRG